jgi:hypothetical protein
MWHPTPRRQPIHESNGEAILWHEPAAQPSAHLGHQCPYALLRGIGSAWMLGACSFGTTTICPSLAAASAAKATACSDSIQMRLAGMEQNGQGSGGADLAVSAPP